jgi:two-component system, NtrC family, nitrogen regulation sensor histidine kinase NtrY
MTLGTRIVAALILVALIPMVVVLALTLVQAEQRARGETERRTAQARRQASILLDAEASDLRAAADRAAADLSADRDGLIAVRRGPEAAARPVARALAERHGLTRVEIRGGTGATLASFGAEPARDAGPVARRVEIRSFRADDETLALVAERRLGDAFVARVAAVTGEEARLGSPGAAACRAPYVELTAAEGVSLCVGVTPADVGAVRRDLLRSFAGVAPVALVAALLVGFVLASRIARPIRALAVRAEAISAEQSRPMSLLPEKDETKRLTLAFDQMLDALSASERQRLAAERAAAWEEIARRLAHEIKNPLSPIQLAVENLRRTRERAPEGFDRAFDEETATILEEVASLRALVDEFAQFARLPRPRVASCDPRAIVASALALFSARLAALSVRVSVDDDAAPAAIRADAEQLGRVLKNVLANALDAMETSVERALAVEVRTDGGEVVFSVRDTGVGFDGEALRRVFEPYFTTRGDRGGTGLGMAIARRIAVEHGGSIRVDGAPGRGATVTLALPIAGPPRDSA